jgi:hypothetical protein
MAKFHGARLSFVTLATALTGLLCTSPVSAEVPDAYPIRLLKMVVPFPAGQGADTAARVLAKELETVKRDAYVEYSVKSGLETAYAGPDALGEFQKRQIESYRQAMRVGNVEPQ